MELIIKASAAALTSAAVGLLIKKSNPELSMLLGAAAAAVMLLSAMGFAEGIARIARLIKTMAGGSQIYIGPVMKCLAVAVITKISTELCRDSSQAAAASALELAGAICALSIAMPVIMSVLTMIGGFL